MSGTDFSGHIPEPEKGMPPFPEGYGQRVIDVNSLYPSVVDVDLFDPDEYLIKAKHIAADHYNSHLPENVELDDKLTIGDFFVVWSCKTLQNWKAILCTNVLDDGLLYEVTYNGDRLEAYLDAYIKVANEVVSDVVVPIRRKS